MLEDVILIPAPQGHFYIYNVFTRTSVGIDSEGLAAFGDLVSGKTVDDTIALRVWNTEYFSNLEGLLADPTRLNRNSFEKDDYKTVNAPEFLQVLRKKFLLPGESDEEYRSRFQEKSSILDAKHFGNFHQQLGQQLFMNGRQDPGEWWVNQKFTEDRGEVRRDNLYGAVQMNYLKSAFPRWIDRGMSVLDIGCGIGLYAKQMAACGAEVLAVDPDRAFLDIARKNNPMNVTFEQAPIGTEGALDTIPENSRDFVFMSDALLFYYVPAHPGPRPDIDHLLGDVKRILKPGGVFVSMEPNYTFWLAPWLGSESHPFTLLTEYLNRSFSVTPPIGQLINDFARNGFLISGLHEVPVGQNFEQVSERARNFAAQFPLWQVLETRAVS